MAFFGELYLRSTRPFLDEARTRAEALFIADVLKPLPGERVLDLCSGHGRHMPHLAFQGARVFGLERDPASLAACSPAMRAHCARGDMYALPFRAAFDALYCWYASLFISDDDDRNLAVLVQAASAVRPGGRLLIHGHNPVRLAREPESHFDAPLADGAHLVETTRYDAARGLLVGCRILEEQDGRRLEGAFIVRCLDLSGFRRFAVEAGLVVEASFGDIEARPPGPDSPDLIVLLRRPVTPVRLPGPRASSRP